MHSAHELLLSGKPSSYPLGGFSMPLEVHFLKKKSAIVYLFVYFLRFTEKSSKTQIFKKVKNLPINKEKVPQNNCLRYCFLCEDRTIEMFLRFRCLDLNTRHNHSASLRFCFQGFYSTISISVPPIKTTLIFSFDSTTTHSMICLTSLSSYSIGWFCSPSSMVKISSSRDLALSLF